MCSVIKDLLSVSLFIAMCQLYLHLFSASGTFDPEDSGTVTCQIEQSAVGATRAMYSYCFSVGCSFFDIHHFSRSSFFEYMFVSYIFHYTNLCSFFTIVNFPSDSFPISHVHAILNLSLSARFSHGADLIFFRKGFIYEAYQKISICSVRGRFSTLCCITATFCPGSHGSRIQPSTHF